MFIWFWFPFTTDPKPIARPDGIQNGLPAFSINLRGFAPPGDISHKLEDAPGATDSGMLAGLRINAIVLPSGDHRGVVSVKFASEVNCTGTELESIRQMREIVPIWFSKIIR